MDKALTVVACLLLTGCTPWMPPLDLSLKPQLPCSVGPIVLDKSDQLSRATKQQIVGLNESGAAICGWKPPTR